MADGRWQMADRRSQVADGRWQVADGRWQVGIDNEIENFIKKITLKKLVYNAAKGI